MRSYSYSAQLAGDNLAGEVPANSIEEARTILENMGFTRINVNDVQDNKIRPPKAEKPLEQTMIDLSKHVANQQEDNDANRSKRRIGKIQRIITGGKDIIPVINGDLLSGAVAVKQVAMHPDSQGKMQYLFVLEEDVEE